MTFKVIHDVIKKLRLYNVSIHRNFKQNWFINECARKKTVKIPESRSHGVLESRRFLVTYRRTYVLKKNNNSCTVQSRNMRLLYDKWNILV